jgi:hypothetical protein
MDGSVRAKKKQAATTRNYGSIKEIDYNASVQNNEILRSPLTLASAKKFW